MENLKERVIVTPYGVLKLQAITDEEMRKMKKWLLENPNIVLQEN